MTDQGWVVTCDPGVDDAIALAVAAGRADCAVQAVVAGGGNVDAATAWRNAAGLAVLFGLDVPIGVGSAVPLDGGLLAWADARRPPGGDRRHGDGPDYGDGGQNGGAPEPDGERQEPGGHGSDGLAGLSDQLPRVSGTPATGGPLVRGRVIALGPLTDVALALRADRRLDRVVWMGGTIGCNVVPSDRPDSSGARRSSTGVASTGEPEAPGGRGTSAGPASPGWADPEFNASADIVAVQEVLAAGPDLAVVPREVTGQVTLDAADLDRWDAGSGAARLCAALVRAKRRGGTPMLHDPVAVVAALEPDLFTWQVGPLRCSSGGARPPGALVPGHEHGSPVRVAAAVDAPAVRRRIVAAVLAMSG